MSYEFIPTKSASTPIAAALRAFEDELIATKGRLLREGLASAASPAEILSGLSFSLQQYCAVVLEAPLGSPVLAVLPSDAGTPTAEAKFKGVPAVVRVVQRTTGSTGWFEVYRRGATGPVGVVHGEEARALLAQAQR